MTAADLKAISDEDLIEAYYGGSNPAGDELHRRFFPRLFAFLKSQFGRWLQEEDREDLASEAILRTLKTKNDPEHRYDRSRGAKSSTWLYTQVRWRALDQLGERPLLSLPEDEEGKVIEPVDEDAATPLEIVERKEAGTVLMDCLQALSERQRTVLLTNLEGAKLAEIAAALEIPYGTAGQRLHHARRGMENCLDGKGYRFVPPGERPPGATIVMRFPDELLIHEE